MALLNPDFSEAFELLPEGKYQVRVASYQCKTSRNTNARMIAWNLQVIGGEFDGRKLSHMTMMEGKGAGILKHFLKTCDGVYEDGPFDPDHYVGCRIGAEVLHEEYNGKPQAKVRDVFPDASARSFEGANETQAADIPF